MRRLLLRSTASSKCCLSRLTLSCSASEPRIIIKRTYARRISKSFIKEVPTSTQRMSYVDYVQQNIKAQEESVSSFVPTYVQKIIMSVKAKLDRKDDGIHPELKILLDKAAVQLYYTCAENTNFVTLCKEFDLPDLFTTWFKLTIMHVWMVLLRLHISLDATSYQRLQHGILTAMWRDVDKRIEIVKESTNISHSVDEMKQVHALHLQTLFEYDEGFLADDITLAAAIWRNLFMEQAFKADRVANVVKYIRATMAHLSEIDSNDILVNGVQEWTVSDQLKMQYES